MNGKRIAWHTTIFCGTIVSIWSVAAFLSGLSQVNWHITELLRQYLITAGLMQDFHTLSDFYTHIKGIEYIIAVMFLGAFPAFYSYLNRPKGGIVTNT
ncbi:hypothetical protein ACFLYW_00360 [Thermodesulfobacteriota bacterium]